MRGGVREGTGPRAESPSLTQGQMADNKSRDGPAMEQVRTETSSEEQKVSQAATKDKRKRNQLTTEEPET